MTSFEFTQGSKRSHDLIFNIGVSEHFLSSAPLSHHIISDPQIYVVTLRHLGDTVKHELKPAALML